MDEDIKNKIITKIDSLTNKIVNLTQKMIQIPSVNPPGSYKEISEFLVEYLLEIGLDVKTIETPKEILNSHGLKPPRPNVLGTFSTGDSGPTLILNGHQDVVAPGPDWTVDPFAGVIKEKKLYGRGAADMKGTIAAMIMAVKALMDAKIALGGQIKLVLCVDEEIGGFAGAQYVVEKGRVRGDFCISEGSIERITRAWNGGWWFNITTLGKSVHGSKPWAGVNAIEKMARVLSRLQMLQDELKGKESRIPGIRYGTLNFGTIHGGEEVNTVCSRCSLAVDRRVTPSEKMETAEMEVKKLLETLSNEDTEFKVDLETFYQTEPCVLPETHILVKTVNKAVKRVIGKEVEVGGSTGFIDGRFFMKYGIPTVGFGASERPGSLHGPDEYVQIKHLVQTTKVYALTICDLLAPK